MVFPAFNRPVRRSRSLLPLYPLERQLPLSWRGQACTFISRRRLRVLARFGAEDSRLLYSLQVTDIDTAQKIKVIPHVHRGKGEIVRLERTEVRFHTFLPFAAAAPQLTSSFARRQRPGTYPLIFFSYQRDKYLFSPDTRSFSRIAYPCDAAPPLSTFQPSQGLETAEKVDAVRRDFGKNIFDIPVPTFTELFAEHAVAPFFVFQVFCVGLWCLDEYWYYSLFTLFMLIVFECTTCFQVSFSGRPPEESRADLPFFTLAPSHRRRVPLHVHQALRHPDSPRGQVDRDPDRRAPPRRPRLDW